MEVLIMVRKANIGMLCLFLVVLFSCAGACNTLRQWEQSSKTDQVCSYFTTFLTGAQLGLPLFGAYAPAAQTIITTALGMTKLLCDASDNLVKTTMQNQVYAEVQKLVELGKLAGIRE
jgi:hypothetical protein